MQVNVYVILSEIYGAKINKLNKTSTKN